MKLKTLFSLLAVPGLIGMTSCETPTGQGTALGAATGAIIGGVAGQSMTNVAIGAGLGAATGAIIGAMVENQQQRRPSNLPYATRSDRNGFVYSPYPPNNLIDVRGIPRGAVVIDPSTNGQFVNP